MISPDPDIPPAPWRLTGEAAAFLSERFTIRLLVRYSDSPVGAYDEHALAKLTLRGPHVFQMSVNLEASLRGGRQIWGFPKTMETLSWKRRGSRIEFKRENETFRVRAFGPSFPLALGFWTIQNLDGRDVRVPGDLRGRARLAWRGRRPALVLSSFEMKIFAPHPR